MGESAAGAMLSGDLHTATAAVAMGAHGDAIVGAGCRTACAHDRHDGTLSIVRRVSAACLTHTQMQTDADLPSPARVPVAS